MGCIVVGVKEKKIVPNKYYLYLNGTLVDFL